MTNESEWKDISEIKDNPYPPAQYQNYYNPWGTPCPSCGYCPHCGRGKWSYPYQPQITWTVGTPSSGSDENA
jgi:hypothetical protein